MNFGFILCSSTTKLFIQMNDFVERPLPLPEPHCDHLDREENGCYAQDGLDEGVGGVGDGGAGGGGLGVGRQDAVRGPDHDYIKGEESKYCGCSREVPLPAKEMALSFKLEYIMHPWKF